MSYSRKLLAYVSPLIGKNKFHTRTKQQAKLEFCNILIFIFIDCKLEDTRLRIKWWLEFMSS